MTKCNAVIPAAEEIGSTIDPAGSAGQEQKERDVI